MRILIVSECGTFAGATLTLLKEGHDVRLFVSESNKKWLLENIVEQVKTIKDGLLWKPDLIVIDGNGFGAQADEWKRDGWKVFGGGSIQDDLASDLAFKSKTVEAFGLTVPETFAFGSRKDASKFALSHGQALSYLGDDEDDDFTPESNDQLAYLLAKTSKDEDGKVLLQKKINGVPVTVEVWYANGTPVSTPICSLETTRFLPQDMGPYVDYATSVVWPSVAKQPRLFQQSLKKLSILLEKRKYTGPMSVSGVVRKEKFYVQRMGTTFRPGALYGFLPLLGEDLGHLLARIAGGSNEPIVCNKMFGCAIRVTVPPYPLDDDAKGAGQIYESSRNLYVEGAPKDAWGKTIFPHDVHAKINGLCTAGVDGIVADVAEVGGSVDEAYQKAELLVKGLEVPFKQARLKDTVYLGEKRLTDLSLMKYDVPGPWMPILGNNVVSPQVARTPKEGSYERQENPTPKHMASSLSFIPKPAS